VLHPRTKTAVNAISVKYKLREEFELGIALIIIIYSTIKTIF
jgi:hypothetical protein